MEKMVYEVIKPYGKRKVGDKLPECREARRKMAEGETVKMIAPLDKNKMEPDSSNFGDGKKNPKNKGV